MKQTPFTPYHLTLGAKMVPFAGYEMPIEYSGISDEHITVREKLGLFDVSHMGEFWIKGAKALDFIQKITSNDASSLTDGKVQYSCFPNGKGGIVDDLLVYRFNQEKFLFNVNAANIDKDWNWCLSQAAELDYGNALELMNDSDQIAQLAVQGPLALKAMSSLTSEPVEQMLYYTFKELTFAGIGNVIFSTTGYTGAGGCEIYVIISKKLKSNAETVETHINVGGHNLLQDIDNIWEEAKDARDDLVQKLSDQKICSF